MSAAPKLKPTTVQNLLETATYYSQRAGNPITDQLRIYIRTTRVLYEVYLRIGFRVAHLQIFQQRRCLLWQIVARPCVSMKLQPGELPSGRGMAFL